MVYTCAYAVLHATNIALEGTALASGPFGSESCESHTFFGNDCALLMKYLNPLETPASDLLEHKKINLGCFSVLDL